MSPIEVETLVPLVVFSTLAVAIVIGLIRYDRQLKRDLAARWTGTVLRLETTFGRLESRPRAGGVATVEPTRRFLVVHYRRDDGMEGAFWVGEPVANPREDETGMPAFAEVAHWPPGHRIEKPAGARWPVHNPAC